jgi:hypothetical protein
MLIYIYISSLVRAWVAARVWEAMVGWFTSLVSRTFPLESVSGKGTTTFVGHSKRSHNII